MRRRDFVTLLGGAAAWPLAARGQQAAIPVLAWLEIGGEYRHPDLRASRYGAFTRGLSEVGVLEGRDVAIDHVPVSNLRDLPGAVKRQVQRKVAVIYGILLIAVAAKEPKHPAGPPTTLGNMRELGAGLNKIKPITRAA